MSVTNVVPQVIVEKDATPAAVPEPGGDVSFGVRVTNNSNEPLTIASLSDDAYGNVATRGSCTTAIGTTLAAAGGTYTCSFTVPVTGDSGSVHTNTLTASATDDEGSTTTDTDDATVTVANVAPTVSVDKAAAPASLPEPGGEFTYTVVVTNTSVEAVTITALTDSVYGNLVTRPGSTCTTAAGTAVGPGAAYTCQFSGAFSAGRAGASLTDVVTVAVADNEGTAASDTDDATVTIADVAPTVSIDKTVIPTSRPEEGGSFTFGVLVTTPRPSR